MYYAKTEHRLCSRYATITHYLSRATSQAKCLEVADQHESRNESDVPACGLTRTCVHPTKTGPYRILRN